MVDIDAMVAGFAAEATCDYVGLWQIAGEIEYELDPTDELSYRPGTYSQSGIRYYAMEVVRHLMAGGLRPGDYCIPDPTLDGFRFWSGTVEDQLRRIEAEWIALGKEPDHLQPICWFALPTAKAVITDVG